MKPGIFAKLFIFAFLISFTNCTTVYRNPAGHLRNDQTELSAEYDAGPNPNDSMGKELIDLNSRIPNFPGISKILTKDQKFRPAFGPIPWRMLQKPNSVKILFIGQDGTHIAEAAGRPATAGFGGRAQDLAKYFGVSSSAAFINTYAFTIRGQYGAHDAPILRKKADGSEQIGYSSLVDNELWLMSQDINSPITQWRNDLITWIIRNNRDSLKMIVLFGGAARDAAGAFVLSKGGQVAPARDLSGIEVPEMEMQSTGGNNESPVPFARDGGDLYAAVLGKKLNYSNEKDLPAAQKALANDPAKWVSQMVLSHGGTNGSGLVSAAQVGGYDIDRKMLINGVPTISLKGLKISDDLTIKNDILVVQLPHPTSLTKTANGPNGAIPTPSGLKAVSKAVGDALKDFEPYVKKERWMIDPDPGMTNDFAAGKPYAYGRADMGPEFYDFGAPASRMVNVSTASRLNQNVIVFGTRDKVEFNPQALQAMTKALPSQMPNAEEMWTARPRSQSTRYIFDSGPGEKYAHIMKSNLPIELVKSHAVNGDFGHYRGTFKDPKVLILADPDGYDDLITARALSGSRGQYLNGLMNDLGVGDKYLVIKTAPFSMEQNNLADWQNIVNKTQDYRSAIIKEVLSDSKPVLIITDGSYAAAEMKRILGAQSKIPVVNILRQPDHKESGIVQAGEQIKRIPAFQKIKVSGKMMDIPRSHLSYYARIWEGTSGDRVLNSPKTNEAFAEVAPYWATSQVVPLSPQENQAVQGMAQKLTEMNLRKGGEPIQEFIKRINLDR